MKILDLRFVNDTGNNLLIKKRYAVHVESPGIITNGRKGFLQEICRYLNEKTREQSIYFRKKYTRAVSNIL